MARTDDDAPWTRQLLIGGAALVVVALLIGGIVSVVALGAAKVTGLGDSQPVATAEPSMYLPSGKPTTRLDPYPAPKGSASPSKRPTAAPSSAKPTKKPTKKPPKIQLKASPTAVAPGERITLTGSYRGHDGAQLQVQRRDGGTWADFPVQTKVTGGTFSTYIITSRTGVNRLRVADKANDRTSKAVRVTVR